MRAHLQGALQGGKHTGEGDLQRAFPVARVGHEIARKIICCLCIPLFTCMTWAPVPVSVEADDPGEADQQGAIEATGCAAENDSLLLCYDERGRDWRNCRSELESLRLCYEKYLAASSTSAPTG